MPSERFEEDVAVASGGTSLPRCRGNGRQLTAAAGQPNVPSILTGEQAA